MAEDSYFKRIQKQMGVSQSEMAEMMGVARGTLVNLENGKTEIVTGSVSNSAGQPEYLYWK